MSHPFDPRMLRGVTLLTRISVYPTRQRQVRFGAPPCRQYGSSQYCAHRLSESLIGEFAHPLLD